MEISRTAAGTLVINDSYNANPASMRAAIDALLACEVPGRRIAVLGVMAELADPVSDHLEIASLLGTHDVELVAVDTTLYGQPAADDPLLALGLLTGNDAVLVKGSRVAGLERLVKLIVG